jgi:hypothetical protein
MCKTVLVLYMHNNVEIRRTVLSVWKRTLSASAFTSTLECSGVLRVWIANICDEQAQQQRGTAQPHLMSVASIRCSEGNVAV